MKVFISWSGEVSRAVAELLRKYLPCMIQDLRPFVSSHDLSSGARWSAQLSKELEEASFGIVCLTPDNLHSDWILFEAGGLTKHVEGRACCLLLQNLNPADISGPLAQFQNCSFSEAGFAKLVLDLNALLPSPLPEGNLQLIFAKWWPDIQADVRTAMSRSAPVNVAPRNPASILDELLLRVRSIEKQLPLSDDTDRFSARVGAHPNASRQSADTFTVTFTRFAANIPDVTFPLDGIFTFQGFLDAIYGKVADYMPPYTYGNGWVFRDVATGAVIRHKRMDSDEIPENIRDERRLTEVGIRPGSTLEAISVTDLNAA